MCNVLSVVPKGSQDMVALIIRTIFAQPAREHIQKQFAEVAAMLDDTRPDLLAFAGFPHRHWGQIWSTNPLERVNKEIKRRTDIVGVFPNPAALLRLAGAVLVEQHDEWEAGDRRYFLRIVHARTEDHEHPDRTGRGGEGTRLSENTPLKGTSHQRPMKAGSLWETVKHKKTIQPCRASLHTTCDTPQQVWLSLRAPTSKRFSGCSATPRPT
jgi:hypothetical protein